MIRQGRRYDLSGQVVRSIRVGGMTHQGRWYDPSGQVVRSVKAGGTIHQGRWYDPSGQVVRSVKAGGMIHQGRRYEPSGQAVQSVRAGGTAIHHNTNIACQTTLLQLSWAGRRSEPAHYSPWPHWALSRRVAHYHP
jgi:hypothetical protein